MGLENQLANVNDASPQAEMAPINHIQPRLISPVIICGCYPATLGAAIFAARAGECRDNGGTEKQRCARGCRVGA